MRVTKFHIDTGTNEVTFSEEYIEELEPEQTEPTHTTEEDLMAMGVDHEYRLTLLELGVI